MSRVLIVMLAGLAAQQPAPSWAAKRKKSKDAEGQDSDEQQATQ